MSLGEYMGQGHFVHDCSIPPSRLPFVHQVVGLLLMFIKVKDDVMATETSSGVVGPRLTLGDGITSG